MTGETAAYLRFLPFFIFCDGHHRENKKSVMKRRKKTKGNTAWSGKAFSGGRMQRCDIAGGILSAVFQQVVAAHAERLGTERPFQCAEWLLRSFPFRQAACARPADAGSGAG